MRGLAHEGMYHEIWGVGLYYCCGLGFADYMALWVADIRMEGLEGNRSIERTMSAPSFALAMAEK